jgi:hypothetical protein
LQCEGSYGVFEKFLHRNLLWRASEGKMEKIAYDHHVPSWSWMANGRGIQFLDIPLGDIDWVNHLHFDMECEYALIGDLGEFQNCIMDTNGDRFDILNVSNGRSKGWILYDVQNGKSLSNEKCFVIGREGKSYYILVVRPTSVDSEYKRVGIGLVRSYHIVKERLNVRVV